MNCFPNCIFLWYCSMCPRCTLFVFDRHFSWAPSFTRLIIVSWNGIWKIPYGLIPTIQSLELWQSSVASWELALWRMCRFCTSTGDSRDPTTHFTRMFTRKPPKLTKSLPITWIPVSSSKCCQQIIWGTLVWVKFRPIICDQCFVWFWKPRTLIHNIMI